MKLPDFGLAEIKRHDKPSCISGVPKPGGGTILRVNGKFIYLDTWDFSRPTSFILEILEGKRQGVIPVDLSVIIKIQRRKDYDFKNSFNIPVVPWTMFHTAQMDWLSNYERYAAKWHSSIKKYKIGFTGRIWKHRALWINELKKMGGYADKLSGNTEDYINSLCEWEIGMILQGKRDITTDGKNRREVEFASMKIPIFMNYQPYYMNDLVPGKHYEYVNKPSDLNGIISKMNPVRIKELTEEAYKWWVDNASAEGVCKTFIQRMQTLGII